MGASNEVLIELSDEFICLSQSFKTKIMSLQTQDLFQDTINDLFRQIHSLKAVSQYVKIDPLYQLLKVLEDVFQILRYRQQPITGELLSWLFKINDQFLIWSDLLESGIYDIGPADPYLLNMVKITSVSSIKRKHSLKESTFVLYSKQSSLSYMFNKITPFYKRLITVETLEDCENIIQHENLDFIFVSSECDLEEIILLHQLSSSKQFIPFIPIVISENPNLLKQLRQAGITDYIDSKISPKSLLNKLVSYSNIMNQSKWIMFPNYDVMSIIETIKPLPEVIIKVQQLILSDSSTTRDITNLLEKDPLLTTKILQMINNPSFGLKQNISTLHHAVSLLGKATIGALILQENVQSQFSSFDLKIYGLDNQRELYSISKKRMDLIVRWYSKVDMGMLPVLATTSLLGNLGIFVIANAIKKFSFEERFMNIAQIHGYRVAEIELFNMTSEEVTASIFEHWKLSDLLTESVRYSYNFENAAVNVKPYALANFIVNTAIDYKIQGKRQENLEDLLEFIKKLGFDEKKFLKAYESIV